MLDPTVRAYVGVGSNIDPERNIVQALDLLKQSVSVTACSVFYRTAPLDRSDQPPFLNGIWQIEAQPGARPLKFDVLRPIETNLGRVRTEDKYAARPIDLDILIYGDVVINEPDLKIPDPDIRARPFIYVPLLELDPELVLPDTHETLASLANPLDKATLHPELAFTEHLRNILATSER